MLTDGFVLCPARRIARAFQSSGAPVYKYVFSHSNDLMFGLGAFHGIELGYVFNTHLGTLREYGLSKQVMKYWTSFAATGQPGARGLEPWPRYACEDYLKIDTPVTSGQGYRDEFCDFWDSLGDLKINL
jgi:para-nitrobenzyl esterase